MGAQIKEVVIQVALQLIFSGYRESILHSYRQFAHIRCVRDRSLEWQTSMGSRVITRRVWRLRHAMSSLVTQLIVNGVSGRTGARQLALDFASGTGNVHFSK